VSFRTVLVLALAAVTLAACTSEDTAETAGNAGTMADDGVPSDAEALRGQAMAIFGTLPTEAPNPANPVTEAKVELGRRLYYEKRLSKNQDISCNSCHQLDAGGVDGEATSPGHKGQRGGRNSPTVYNAALHTAQFWDGRAADVEEQAKGPILNPIEMAIASEEVAVEVIRSIPGYEPLFREAFPGESDPITYDNLARAIGAFERRLQTSGPFDRFTAGDLEALDDAELDGLRTFIESGCIACHSGPAIGGGSFQKLGLITPYETEDLGREEVTGDPADRHVFKVPGLRNIAQTGPWFHDGSVESLPDAVRRMGRHQLGVELDDGTVASIVTFLGALTGEIDAAYIAEPMPLPGSDRTPAPDPS